MNLRAIVPAILSGSAFIALLAVMRFDPDDYQGIDQWATSLVHPLQTLPWVELFIFITTLGSATGIVAVAVLVAVVLRKQYWLVIRLLAVLLGESGSVTLVKELVGRIRPAALPWIGPIHSFSFPSGHAAAAMGLFGFIAIVWARQMPTKSYRLLVVGACGLAIVLIGISRIVLAAHFASDVLAGWLLGGFWLAVAFLIPLSPWDKTRASDTKRI